MSGSTARWFPLAPCVCIDLVFAGRDPLEAVDAAAADGVPAIEFWGWREKDIEAISSRARKHGLEIAAMSLDPAVRILDGEGVPELLRSVRESLIAARRIGCRSLVAHVQPVPMGSAPARPRNPETERVLERQRIHVAEALKRAAPLAEEAGIPLLLEPLNPVVDHHGYCLTRSGDGIDVIRRVASPAVRLLFDIYHMQIAEGNLIANIRAGVDHLAHLHVADVPGRHEPGTGEIDYRNVLRAAASAGYRGYVGMEMVPRAEPREAIRRTLEIIKRANASV